MKNINLKIAYFILAFFGFLFLTNNVQAATYYVTESGNGAKNGADWRNAFQGLPTVLERDSVYYIADGNCGSYKFDDAASGTSYIYLKKATGSSHGTNTGWQPDLGDGTAEYTFWDIQAPYYHLDGQVGNSADFLPGYISHGFKITRQDASPHSMSVRIGVTRNILSHVTLKSVEIASKNIPRGIWPSDSDGIRAYCNDLNLERVWIHDHGGCCVLILSGNRGTIIDSALGRNGHAQVAMQFSPSEHSEILMLHPYVSDWRVMNSHFYDWRSTGNWVLYGGNKNTVFTGNVVFTTGYWDVPRESGDSDGAFDGCMHGDKYGECTGTKVIGNTFANIPYGGRIGSMISGGTTGLQVENNLFYNVKTVSLGRIDLMHPGARKNNWYYGCGSFLSDSSGQQEGTGDPFINSRNYDFRLARQTQSGIRWSSPYDIDRIGKTRGADGTWDRGAYEYTGSSLSIPEPSAPASSPKSPDLNNDKKVNIFDYSIFIQNFGQTGTNPCDLDNNSKVDIFDYNIFIRGFGK